MSNDLPHVISLGAGVQSSTMALMAARGELGPMPTAAVFADTQAEPASVYKWLDWLESELPFPVYRVTRGDLGEDALVLRQSKKSGNIYPKMGIPVFLKAPDGSGGLLKRACTADYKIDVLHREIKRLLGIKRGEKELKVIQWIGISTDEADRMKPSRVPYIENRWPLIESSISRNDCLRWMAECGYPTPPRSACVFCPYHSDREWMRLRDDEPEEFHRAVEWERRCQEGFEQQNALRGRPFLHSSLVPLSQVAFGNQNQRSLFSNECEGMCGV